MNETTQNKEALDIISAFTPRPKKVPAPARQKTAPSKQRAAVPNPAPSAAASDSSTLPEVVTPPAQTVSEPAPPVTNPEPKFFRSFPAAAAAAASVKPWGKKPPLALLILLLQFALLGAAGADTAAPTNTSIVRGTTTGAVEADVTFSKNEEDHISLF